MDQYFGTIKKVLNDNGTAAIQGIVIKDELSKDIEEMRILFKNIYFQVGFYLNKI